MPDMVRKKDELAVTVPWKVYVGHLTQEEWLATPLNDAAQAELKRFAKGIKRTEGEDPDMHVFTVLEKFKEAKDKGYNQRRAQRVGHHNKKVMERLNRSRMWEAAYFDGEGEDEEGQGSEDGADDELDVDY